MNVLLPVIQTIANMFVAINNEFKKLAENTYVIRVIGTAFQALGGVIALVGAGISYVAETITKIVQTIEKLVTGKLNEIEAIWTNWDNSNSIGASAIKTFADIGNIWQFSSGGFPKEDGLFYANHNELVGRFSNGKTAVANNDEITNGIYMAVKEAMQDANIGNGVAIYLDGKIIAQNVENRLNNRGKTLFSGGNLNYGK